MGNDESKEGLPDEGDIDNPEHSIGNGNQTMIAAPRDGDDAKKSGPSGGTN